jgi:hypothetical protein
MKFDPQFMCVHGNTGECQACARDKFVDEAMTDKDIDWQRFVGSRLAKAIQDEVHVDEAHGFPPGTSAEDLADDILARLVSGLLGDSGPALGSYYRKKLDAANAEIAQLHAALADTANELRSWEEGYQQDLLAHMETAVKLKEAEARIEDLEKVRQRAQAMYVPFDTPGFSDSWSVAGSYEPPWFTARRMALRAALESLQEHGYTCGWCKWGREGNVPKTKREYDRHVQETGHRGDKPWLTRR